MSAFFSKHIYTHYATYSDSIGESIVFVHLFSQNKLFLFQLQHALPTYLPPSGKTGGGCGDTGPDGQQTILKHTPSRHGGEVTRCGIHTRGADGDAEGGTC